MISYEYNTYKLMVLLLPHSTWVDTGDDDDGDDGDDGEEDDDDGDDDDDDDGDDDYDDDDDGGGCKCGATSGLDGTC